MPNVQRHDNEKYWLSIRQKMAELDPESAKRDADIRLYDQKHKFENLEASRKPVYLVSVDPNKNGGNNLSVCTPYVAAKMLAEGSHRVATSQEAQTWIDQQAKQKLDLEQAESKKQQPLVTELVSALAGLGEQKRAGGKQSGASPQQ
jgi:hypothetical protein